MKVYTAIYQEVYNTDNGVQYGECFFIDSSDSFSFLMTVVNLFLKKRCKRQYILDGASWQTKQVNAKATGECIGLVKINEHLF